MCASPVTTSPQDELRSPFFNTMLPQDMATGPSSGGAPYAGNSSLPREPSLDALYLSHVSPVIQLAQFPPECSPNSSPALHRRYSLQDDQLQSIYLDAEVMQRYYSEPNLIYGMPPSPGSLPSSMYTAESSTMLARDTFVGDQPQHAWVTQSASDVMLISPHEPVFPTAFGYGQSDSAESIDIYAQPPLYAIHAYDSFEFPALQEQNNAGVVLAGPHA